jgi:hypothetical protein
MVRTDPEACSSGFTREALRPEVRNTQLSAGWQQVVNICKWLGHGQVGGLHICGNEPQFTRLPRLWKHGRPIKAPSVEEPHAPNDFALKKHVLDLMEWVRELEAEEAEVFIDVANGLPVHWSLDGTDLYFARACDCPA